MSDFSATINNGEFVINSIWVAWESDDIVVFEADTKSKYPRVLTTSEDGVYIVPNGNSQNLDESSTDETTQINITFPSEDWRVLTAEGGRYTVTVVAVRESRRCVGDKYLWTK